MQRKSSHSSPPITPARSVDEILTGPQFQRIRLASQSLLPAFRQIARDPSREPVEVKDAIAEAQACLDNRDTVHGTSELLTTLALSGMPGFAIGQVDWLMLARTDPPSGSGQSIAHQPVLREWFYTEKGEAWCVALESRRRLRTAPVHQLEGARLCIGDGLNHAIGAEREAVDALANQVQLRRYVGSAYALCLLAMGVVDIVVDTGVSDKEMAVLGPIVRAAGGVVADWGGDAAHFGRILAAANEPLLRRALDLLAWAPASGQVMPASRLQ